MIKNYEVKYNYLLLSATYIYIYINNIILIFTDDIKLTNTPIGGIVSEIKSN
jgi:hypothetical protein